MKQRVKLAQALVHDPELVLLDEPTNGLDPAGRDDMLGLIRRIGTEFGISVLVTSHLLGELERVCDHVVVIDGGRLLRHSTTASVTAADRRSSPSRSTATTAALLARLRGRASPSTPTGGCSHVDVHRRARRTTWSATRSPSSASGWSGWSGGGTGWPRSSPTTERGSR